MKLLIIASFREYLTEVARLCRQVNIEGYSFSKVIGHLPGPSSNHLND